MFDSCTSLCCSTPKLLSECHDARLHHLSHRFKICHGHRVHPLVRRFLDQAFHHVDALVADSIDVNCPKACTISQPQVLRSGGEFCLQVGVQAQAAWAKWRATYV